MPGKSQIADRIAARGATKTAALAAVEAVLDEITSALAAGERVTLTGFGTFEAAGRAARTARNPRTGETLEVAATTVARFHPGAGLRAR
ncbi:HU family DNA-binding protein, partial [Cellulomonas sp. P5_C6]